ncbi:MAG: serine hydrolase [Ignavibacteria bacterium]
MRITLIITILLALNLNAPKSYDSKSEVADKLDIFMNECKELDLFSGTILVAKDGNIIFERSYGYSYKENNYLNTNLTKYNIGSIGKIFTAIMILQLVQENKISLDDKLNKYLDLFNQEISSKVSIRDLLTHSSGFGDFINHPEYRKNKEKYKEMNQLLKLISGTELQFEPGTEKRYSNSGYVILGGVIEKITNKTYTENMSERILEPLGMTSSGYIDWGFNDPLKATGYLKDIKGNLMDNNDLGLQATPAGGMYSTVEDILKLDQSLLNDNKLLNDVHKNIFFNDFSVSPKGFYEDYKKNVNAGNAFAGGAPGINALWLQLPGKGYTAVLLSNYDHAAEAIEIQITSILKGENYIKPNLPLPNTLYNLLQKDGQENFAKHLRSFISSNVYNIENDRQLNNIGYMFLQNELTIAAIEIFKLNTELFPDIANCFDSLGEAYLKAGNKEEAKKSYSKVVLLDPENEGAKKILDSLNP